MGEAFTDLFCNNAQLGTLKFHYKNKNAWEMQLKSGSSISPNVDDVDSAIFCGHGLAKGKDKNGYEYPYNSLHFYTCNSATNLHSMENAPAANLNVTEANWGSGSAKTKWVFVYACNFLNPVDGAYKSVMNGVHQVLGFFTRMYITTEVTDDLAYYLACDYTIRASFINSTRDKMGPHMNEKLVANIITAKQSVEDTISEYSSKPSPWGRGGTYYEGEYVMRVK